MLDPSALANDLIQQLGIPAGAAQDKIRILAKVIIEHFASNAEVDLSGVGISVDQVSAGAETRSASKSGSGRLH
jgi:hypothetical protein